MIVLRRYVRFFASFPELIELSLSREFKQRMKRFNVACLDLHDPRKDSLWKSGARISPCRV
jgi:hypothetical protein